MNLRRGDVFWADLGYKMRPYLVVQTDAINQNSNCTMVVPLTTKMEKLYPTSAVICWGSIKPSVAKCAHILSVQVDPAWSAIEHLPPQIMDHVDMALRSAIGV